MNRTTIYILSILLVLTVQLNAQDKSIRFNDVTQQAGISFKYSFGDYTYENILESSGSGITIFDYNGDKLMDIYILNGTYLEGISDAEGKVFEGTHNELYKNNGDGTFTEVSEKAGVDDQHWSMAAGPIDIDNDGDEELFLLNYGTNVFFRNNGDGTFTDIISELGLSGPKKLNGFEKWSVGVAFWDYNLDGRLDAMVGNFLAFDPKYVSETMPEMMPHPSEYKGQSSILYEQLPNGKFVDVTEQNKLLYPDSKCMGLTVFDYDEDGDLDLFQGNDHQFNFLFQNDKGKFKELAIASGVAANSKGQPTGSMHGSIGDIDGDGLTDLLVTDLKYGALYKNIGDGLFTDITETSGIAGPFAGKGEWGAALFDYDNDSDLDIFSANGTAEELILQYPLLLENNGKGHFMNIGKEHSEYFSKKRSGRTIATFDYDNDGDLDLIVSHIDLEATASLLENDGGNKNNWIGFSLNGKNGVSTAIAAKVTVYSGNKKIVRINQRANSYMSYNDPRMLVGIGKNKSIELVEVVWNNGQIETFKNPKINRYYSIKQGTGILKKY
jgi:hypothetical protein